MVTLSPQIFFKKVGILLQAKGIVDEIECGSHAEGQNPRGRGSRAPPNPLTDVEPADVTRQIAIFNGVTSESDRPSNCTSETEEKEVCSTCSSKRDIPKNSKTHDTGRSKAKTKKTMPTM